MFGQCLVVSVVSVSWLDPDWYKQFIGKAAGVKSALYSTSLTTELVVNDRFFKILAFFVGV